MKSASLTIAWPAVPDDTEPLAASAQHRREIERLEREVDRLRQALTEPRQQTAERCYDLRASRRRC